MFIIALTAVVLTGAISGLLALVVTQLRQRNVSSEQEEAPAVSEKDTARPDQVPAAVHSTSQRSQPRVGRGSPAYVGLLAVAALAYYLYSQKGSVRTKTFQYRTCMGPPSAAERLRLFPNLYGFHHPIITSSQEAQSLFDQGLLLLWNYDQPEAEAVFRLGLDADPEASMFHWGIQQAVGPGANRAVLSERPLYPAFAPDNFPTMQSSAHKAWELAKKALAANPESAVAQRDKAFAEAALLRWPDESAYGEARDTAEKKFSSFLQHWGEENADAAALATAGEALLNLHPWEYYLPNGAMKETAQHAESLLNAALKLDSGNPLANHLLIHISEASSTDSESPLTAHRGLASANRMTYGEGAWKANQGHLLHMPSHTFVRTGRYRDAVLANVNAYNADLHFGGNCMQPYEPEHNTDMLIFAANMAGQTKIAEEFALKIREFGRAMFFEQPANETQNWAKHPLFLVQHARWADIMKVQKPGLGDRANCPSGGFEFAMVVWRYVRSMALAAKAEGLKQAGEEEGFKQANKFLDSYLQLLREAETLVEPEEQTFPPAVYMCEHKGLAQIYLLTAEARVDTLRGNLKAAAEKLQSAVKIEDAFAYMEPPRVYQPIRQCLGYVLLQGNRVEEAVEVYRADLAIFPDNGWSLHGISEALHRQGDFAEVARLKPGFEDAWTHADVQSDSSCPQFSAPWSSTSL